MNFSGINLLPLGLLDKHLKDYYLDADFKVYSTRKMKAPILMQGTKSTAASECGRVYTLDGSPYTAGFLRALVQRNASAKELFAQHTSPITIVSKLPIIETSNLSHVYLVEQGIKDRGFVIAQVSQPDGHLVFESKPAIHMTEQSYRSEMTRLAINKPGTKFVALQIVASAVSGDIKWE